MAAFSFEAASVQRDNYFRRQILRSYVHDEGAAMLFWGSCQPRGYFLNAYDLSILYQMLLNKGEYNGKRYLKPENNEYFTAYHSDISRRGLGFDKPEKDNATGKRTLSCLSASPQNKLWSYRIIQVLVFGLIRNIICVIFLSNRVFNSRKNNLLGQMNIRGKIQDAIYTALKSEETRKACAQFQ